MFLAGESLLETSQWKGSGWKTDSPPILHGQDLDALCPRSSSCSTLRLRGKAHRAVGLVGCACTQGVLTEGQGLRVVRGGMPGDGRAREPLSANSFCVEGHLRTTNDWAYAASQGGERFQTAPRRSGFPSTRAFAGTWEGAAPISSVHLPKLREVQSRHRRCGAELGLPILGSGRWQRTHKASGGKIAFASGPKPEGLVLVGELRHRNWNFRHKLAGRADVGEFGPSQQDGLAAIGSTCLLLGAVWQEHRNGRSSGVSAIRFRGGGEKKTRGGGR